MPWRRHGGLKRGTVRQRMNRLIGSTVPKPFSRLGRATQEVIRFGFDPRPGYDLVGIVALCHARRTTKPARSSRAAVGRLHCWHDLPPRITLAESAWEGIAGDCQEIGRA